MRDFIVYFNQKVNPKFHMNNLPGSGRVDLMARCVSSALWLSHKVRKDTNIHLFLSRNKKLITFYGGRIKRISPDERNIASWLRKSLQKEGKIQSGIETEETDFQKLLEKFSEKKLYLLTEEGKDIRKTRPKENPIFLLGDHLDLPPEILELARKHKPEEISLGPQSYLASHCIVLANNELDRKSK